MKNYFKNYLFFLGLAVLTIFLFGCSTNSYRANAGPSFYAKNASRYLAESEKSQPTLALEYRLRAALAYTQAENMKEASRVLREAQIPDILPTPLKHQVLEARMALLKEEKFKAIALLQTTLSAEEFQAGANFISDSNSSIDPSKTPSHMALLLPLQGQHHMAAKTIKEGFFSAYYRYKNHAPGLTIQVYDTGSGELVADAYKKAMAAGADVIVGPLSKPEVQSLIELRPPIPVLALNSLPDARVPNHIYQFGLIPEDDVFTVAEFARRQGRTYAMALVPKSEWGNRMLEAFTRAFERTGGRVVASQTINPSSDINAQVQKLLNADKSEGSRQPDMIFMAMSPELARQVKPLLNFYRAENIPVYATGSIYSGVPSASRDQDLNGIYFCDMPMVLKQDATVMQSPRYFALGLDAFRIALQLKDPTTLLSGFDANTGHLTLNNHQRIERQLTCAKFENGVPSPR